MHNSSVYLFHELLPIFASLYAFMSVILLHNILRVKTIKVWAVTKIRNSGARLHFLHSFMTPSKNVTKHCQQSSRYQPPSGWVSSSFLGVHDIYSYRTLKGHSWAVWNNLWSSTARSLFIHPEQIYQIFLQPTTGRGGKKKSSFDGDALFSEKLPWTAFINHPWRKKTLAVPGTAFICTSSSQHF